MPKEVFHLFLADRCFNSGKTNPQCDNFVHKWSLPFFLGAVSPDIFFYDLPSFRLDQLGNRLHDFIGRYGIDPVHEWLAKDAKLLPPAAFAWGLGFASHFLADATWHPVIDELAVSLDFCGKRKISPLGCHRLVESELESYWIRQGGGAGYVSGPDGAPGKYIGLLKRFRGDKDLFGNISSIYRLFLARTGLAPLPGQAGIKRCFLNQNFLLRIFENRALGRRRDSLLATRATLYPAVLIVPERPVLPSGPLLDVPVGRNPFSEEFMRDGLAFLTSRLSGFAERLLPFLPS